MAKKIRITHMPKDEDQIFFNISYKGFPFLHTHDHFFEIMFIVEGEIQHTVLDKTTNLGENTLCFITPDLIHSINIQPNSHYINMGINEKYFNNSKFNKRISFYFFYCPKSKSNKESNQPAFDLTR